MLAQPFYPAVPRPWMVYYSAITDEDKASIENEQRNLVRYLGSLKTICAALLPKEAVIWSDQAELNWQAAVDRGVQALLSKRPQVRGVPER